MEATSALEAMFERHRRDAWPWVVITKHAFDTVSEIAAADPSLAERLYRAIASPLPVYLLEARRLETMLKIAMRTKLSVPCAETLRLFEPHVPWRKDVLEWREACYRTASDSGASLASRDRRTPVLQSGVPFEAGLVPATR
jgi:hypothetical protein